MNQLQAWQYRRFHVSYLLAWLAAGILLGLVAAKIGWLQAGSLWLVCAVLLMIGSLRSRRWWAVGLAVVAGIIIGSSRGSTVLQDINTYKRYEGNRVVLSGVIDDDPVYGSQGVQQFRLRSVNIDSRSMRGEVFVSTHNVLDVKRGDRVELSGKLSGGFGSYQATMRYATLVRAEQAHDPVREVRDRFAAGVRNVVAEPSASLGIGFVVGQRSALPEKLDDQLRAVGLTHIVVASGYNLTILVRFMRRLLARHSKYLAAISSGGLMVAFVAVSGLSPSMTRASAVTGLSLLAWYYGRRFHPLILILYVAAATAWWYPVYVWSDIGWYLSFLAFAGVLMLAPLIVNLIYRDRAAPAISQLVIETVSATIMTLPLILFIFGQLPVFTLLSNILVAPIIPLAMMVTALSGVVGMISPAAFGLAGLAANYVIGYVVSVVELLAGVPWAQLNLTISAGVMSFMYAMVVGVGITLWYKTRYNFRASSVVD